MNVSQLISKGGYAALLLSPLLVFCFAFNDPFFGDSVSTTARAALRIYESGLTTIFYPVEQDPGHPTLIPFLLACVWTVLGKSLWVSHLFSAFWGVFALYWLGRLANRNTWTLLLAALSPYFIAQNALILTHVPLLGAFLMANVALKEKRFGLLAFAGCLMAVIHLEASFLWFGLFLADFLSDRFSGSPDFLNWASPKRAAAYAAPLFVLGVWAYIHQQQTGWLFISPVYIDHRTPAGAFQMVKNLALCGTRLADFGHFALFFGLIWLQFRRETHFNWREWLNPVVQTAVLCVCVSYFLTNSIGHRYFLPVIFLWIAFFAQKLGQLDAILQWRGALGVALVLALCMKAYIPGRTMGDATLAYRDYFKLEKTLLERLGKTPVYTYAPLSHDGRTTYLDSSKGLNVKRLYEANLSDCPVVMKSALTGEFTDSQKTVLKKYWRVEKYQSGWVTAELYFNPERGGSQN